jgi:hypothetical protein
VEQPPDRPVAARSEDQKVKRRAVERELLGGVAVSHVGFDPELSDPLTCQRQAPIDPLIRRSGTFEEINGERDRLERRHLGTQFVREPAGDEDRVLALRGTRRSRRRFRVGPRDVPDSRPVPGRRRTAHH